MPKIKKPLPKQVKRETPTCIAMLFAEDCLTSKEDDALSLIRVVDTVEIPPPSSTLGIGHGLELGNLKLIAMLRASQPLEGACNFLIVCRGPNGHSEPIALVPTSFDALVEPHDVGSPISKNLVSEFHIAWDGEGVYWLELLVDDAVIASTPLVVRIDRSLPPFDLNVE